MHGLVRKLEFMGLIDVLPEAEGVRKLRLSEKGRRWLPESLGAVGEAEQRIEERLEPAEREHLIEVLETVERAVRPPRPFWPWP